jgi:hypothetical protein
MCVELHATYHQRGCAGSEASARWRTAFDELADASLVAVRPWQELRERAGRYAECAGQQATSDPSWQSLHTYFQEVSKAASAEAAIGVARNQAAALGPSAKVAAMPPRCIQCQDSLADVECGVVAWLASFGCSPWDAEGQLLNRDGTARCQCGPGSTTPTVAGRARISSADNAFSPVSESASGTAARFRLFRRERSRTEPLGSCGFDATESNILGFGNRDSRGA